MAYSDYQVKYIDNILPDSRPLDISSEATLYFDIGNLSHLNGEALPAVSLILEEVKENPVKRVINKAPTFKISKGLRDFSTNYSEALKIGGDEAKQLLSRRTLLTHLALVESGFNSFLLNRSGAPAYGYFQFMLGNYKGKNHNNISLYGGVDLNTFRKSPVLLIRAANKLANSFILSFSKTELNRLHNMGWTDNAIIAGCWLGGPGGVRAYAFNNNNRSDGATTVGARMKAFNY